MYTDFYCIVCFSLTAKCFIRITTAKEERTLFVQVCRISIEMFVVTQTLPSRVSNNRLRVNQSKTYLKETRIIVIYALAARILESHTLSLVSQQIIG